jgi:hypothetical protein
MTGNQIQYWANQEKIRSNKAMETENNRHNKEMERIDQLKANAQISSASAALMNASENARHNVILESLQQEQLGLASKQLDSQMLVNQAQVGNLEAQRKSTLAGIAQGWEKLDYYEMDVKSQKAYREAQADALNSKAFSDTMSGIEKFTKVGKALIDLLH